MEICKSKFLVAFFWIALFCASGYYVSAQNGFQPFSFFYKKEKPSKLDLKVSSVCHYYQDGIDVGCQNNGTIFGNWEASDLTCRHKFFNFPDVKPGDSGEDTINLSVTGGNACGEMKIEDILDEGNKCTEPETDSKFDRDCRYKKPGTKERDGEMRENLEVRIWLDQGEKLGFQGKDDLGEGDNIFNHNDALMMDWTNLKKCPKIFELRKFLRSDRQKYWRDCERSDSDGDGMKCRDKVCNGVARDGKLLDGVTYYIGFGWRLPEKTGNEVQSDSLKFDVKFTARDNTSCKPCMNFCEKCEDRCED